MDINTHFVAQCCVHHPVLLQRAFIVKGFTDNTCLKVCAVITFNNDIAAGQTGSDHFLNRLCVHQFGQTGYFQSRRKTLRFYRTVF